MKTNLSTLMSIATIEEGKFTNLAYQLKKVLTEKQKHSILNLVERKTVA